MITIFRKICCLLLVIIFVSIAAVSASAAETIQYSLPELDISVNIPADMVVFTRDISSDDPNLAANGLTQDNLLSDMTKKNIYLDSIDKTANDEIIVTMISTAIDNFYQYSDSALSKIQEAVAKEYEANGITYIRSEKYQRHDNVMFIKIYIRQPYGDLTTYGLQYFTVYNNKAINITLHSFTGQISSAQESKLQNVVDTVKFGSDPQLSEAASSASTDINDFTVADVVLSIIISFVLYALPIIIYRYGIRKAPVEPRKASLISIINVFIAFVLWVLLIKWLGGTIEFSYATIFWYFANYEILRRGKKNINESDSNKSSSAYQFGVINSNNNIASPIESQQQTEIQFCHMCGNRLLQDNFYCDKCGTKVRNT